MKRIKFISNSNGQIQMQVQRTQAIHVFFPTALNPSPSRSDSFIPLSRRPHPSNSFPPLLPASPSNGIITRLESLLQSSLPIPLHFPLSSIWTFFLVSAFHLVKSKCNICISITNYRKFEIISHSFHRCRMSASKTALARLNLSTLKLQPSLDRRPGL
jgi:hypothetical protein